MIKNNYALYARGIYKAYKKVDVLKGVDFQIEKGKIFALLGSNGAGKTTAVKILSNILSADKGIVRICGEDLKRNPEKVKPKISCTGQFTALDETMTGRANLHLSGRLFHIANYKEKAEALLNQFDLVDAANRKAMTYSGGMKRRLDIAMSLMGEPELIFLDEPTTGLDPQSRNTMWGIIRELANRGIAVFLTTQYLEEAEQLADDIAILHDGIIIAQGTSKSLKERLPKGFVELCFENKIVLHQARALCDDIEAYEGVVVDEDELKLSIPTDFSIGEMQAILAHFIENGIRVEEISQKKPTLEDVFLTLTTKEAVDII